MDHMIDQFFHKDLKLLDNKNHKPSLQDILLEEDDPYCMADRKPSLNAHQRGAALFINREDAEAAPADQAKCDTFTTRPDQAP